MDDHAFFAKHLDGREPSSDELTKLAFTGFAHFTALQVRSGKARGLDLHLARLREASLAFFGTALSDDLVREYLRDTVERSPADISLTATFFSRAGEFTAPSAPETPAVLVRSSAAANGPAGPLGLDVVPHERPLPNIKHVGESAKTLYLRQAVAKGFDDALFVGPKGEISEATIWNIAFWDGESVIWPTAPHLKGTTMGIVRRQLTALGVPQRDEALSVGDVARLREAAVMNSWSSGISVRAIGGQEMLVGGFADLLHHAYEKEPWQKI